MPSRRVWWLRTVLFALTLVFLVAVSGAVYQAVSFRADTQRFLHPGKLVNAGGFSLNVFCTGQGRPTIVLEAGLADSLDSAGEEPPYILVGGGFLVRVFNGKYSDEVAGIVLVDSTQEDQYRLLPQAWSTLRAATRQRAQRQAFSYLYRPWAGSTGIAPEGSGSAALATPIQVPQGQDQ
jgi:hypothetical protein